MIKFFKKHWEVLSYLIFGVLTTLLNIVLYALFSQLFGYTAANSWGNVLDNALCILFAYCTNRAFVFRSKTTGKAMAKEFGTFVTCRLGTMVLDAAIMIVGGNLLAAQGAALVNAGWAVADPKQSAIYVPYEQQARDNGRGLWQGQFYKPWDWREIQSKKPKIKVIKPKQPKKSILDF